jgi:hypothetical protein
MKKLLVIMVLCFGVIGARAQSISMSDLTNLATINLTDGNNFLTSGKPFKQEYEQDVNGLTLRHYVGITAASRPETLTIGDGIKTKSNKVLHTVTYNTTDTKYLLHLIAEAQSAELKKNFEGADQFNNIYIFDNFLYSVHVFIRTDNSGGFVKVEQKDFVE